MRIRLAELKIKVKTLAFEGALIHRTEIVHRENARLCERYGRPRKAARPVRTPTEAARKAMQVVKFDRSRRLYAWLDAQPDGAELARGIGEHERAAFDSLRAHRTRPLRQEARTSLLAYGFLRGRDYSRMETPNTAKDPDWEEVLATVKRFDGTGTRAAEFPEWRKAAEAYLREGRLNDRKRWRHPVADATEAAVAS